jgi:hypothetical protein
VQLDLELQTLSLDFAVTSDLVDLLGEAAVRARIALLAHNYANEHSLKIIGEIVIGTRSGETPGYGTYRVDALCVVQP